MVEFRLKSIRKLDVNNCIWAIEASRILGISKPTFEKRILMGRYDLRCKRCPKGFMYSIFDVFKIAHPRAFDDQIERFIREFRDKKGINSYGKKRGGK